MLISRQSVIISMPFCPNCLHGEYRDIFLMNPQKTVLSCSHNYNKVEIRHHKN